MDGYTVLHGTGEGINRGVDYKGWVSREKRVNLN